MAADLDELRERLVELGILVDEYAREVQTWGHTAVESRFVQAGHEYQLQARLVGPITTRMRMQAGMLLNEARTLLDGLATVLALRNGKTPDRSLFFPIGKSREGFIQHNRKQIKLLSEGDRAILEALEPWRGSDYVLWNLHELDRTRKHTELCANDVVLMTFFQLWPTGKMLECSPGIHLARGQDVDIRQFQAIASIRANSNIFLKPWALLYFPGFEPIRQENGEDTPSVETFLKMVVERVGEVISAFD